MNLHAELMLPTNSVTELLTDKVVCRCLRVTESEVVEAVTAGGAETVRDLRCSNGAGSGCLSCHSQLREYIRRYQAERAAIHGTEPHPCTSTAGCLV